MSENYALEQALGRLMSEASEEYACAGWLGDWAKQMSEEWYGDIENSVMHSLSNAISALHKHLGYWVDFRWNEERGEYYIRYDPANTIDEWMKPPATE